MLHWEEEMFPYSITGWRGYAVAIGLVGLAAFLRFFIGLFEQGVVYFALFYPAVVIATLLSDYRAGIVALVLFVIAAWFLFLPPQFSFALKETAALVNIALFTVSSALLIWLSNDYRNAVHELREEKSFRDLLLDEVRHRSRNSVAVAKTIVDNTLKSDPQAAATINGRLATLLSADSLLMEETGAGECLQTVLNNELSPYGTDQVIATGSDIVLPARHARAWALIVHELATNAVKYGALGCPDGRVLITWLRVGENLDFWWVETGGSDAPKTPASGGFGTKLIDAMVKSLGGTITRNLERDGLKCSISVPLSELELPVRTQTPSRIVQPAE
jgi:two-component sensor histidine kinase